MLAQLSNAVMTLISQQPFSWGTKETQGALWVCPCMKEAVQKFSDMSGPTAQYQHLRLPSESRISSLREAK